MGSDLWLERARPQLLCPLSPQEILNYISRKEFEPLLRVDQLNLEREKHKVFLRFSECGRSSGSPWGPGSLWYPRVFKALTPPSLPFLGEEEISFPPTYRYERGSRDTYAWHKQKPTGVSEENGLGQRRPPQDCGESRVCVGSSLCTYLSSLCGPLRVILGVGGGCWTQCGRGMGLS